jgi:hypothetical protein
MQRVIADPTKENFTHLVNNQLTIRSPKAADIPDQMIFDIISAGTRSLFTIQKLLPQFPAKVVRAKLNQMTNKGRLAGCTCGCSGNFEIKEKDESQLR